MRLADIDAPEMGQPFGKPARRLAVDLALEKTVRVNYTFKDKYGRLIGEVFLPDGKLLNEEMLKAGLAWHYRVKHPHSSFLEPEHQYLPNAPCAIYCVPSLPLTCLHPGPEPLRHLPSSTLLAAPETASTLINLF